MMSTMSKMMLPCQEDPMPMMTLPCQEDPMGMMIFTMPNVVLGWVIRLREKSAF